jgi:SAM-dependent methyltransferase
LVISLLGASCAQHDAPHASAGPQASAQEPTRQPDVPYVPTPPEVVAEMLRLANVKANDVVYDLGCGDGRIVITAAKEYGARGVGIDINPERIKESTANAEKAGVSNRVKFVIQDLFTTDFREATVVMLYLLPDVNLKLRPKLWSDLKPGTRIVSHSFDMGDWKPDKVVKVPIEGSERTIYYWTVPATR